MTFSLTENQFFREDLFLCNSSLVAVVVFGGHDVEDSNVRGRRFRGVLRRNGGLGARRNLFLEDVAEDGPPPRAAAETEAAAAAGLVDARPVRPRVAAVEPSPAAGRGAVWMAIQ